MQASRVTFTALVFALCAIAASVSAQGVSPAPAPPTVPPITISL